MDERPFDTKNVRGAYAGQHWIETDLLNPTSHETSASSGSASRSAPVTAGEGVSVRISW